MKKMLSLLLIAIMLLVGFACAEETTSSSFRPMLTNMAGFSSEEWYFDSLNRALLTVMLSVDFIQSDANTTGAEPELFSSSFVGKAQDSLMVLYRCGDTDLIIVYNPNMQTASFDFCDSVSDSVIESSLNQVCSDGCYKNDTDDIALVVDTILEVMNSDN